MNAQPRRRWLQFGLRELAISVALMAATIVVFKSGWTWGIRADDQHDASRMLVATFAASGSCLFLSVGVLLRRPGRAAEVGATVGLLVGLACWYVVTTFASAFGGL